MKKKNNITMDGLNTKKESIQDLKNLMKLNNSLLIKLNRKYYQNIFKILQNLKKEMIIQKTNAINLAF